MLSIKVSLKAKKIMSLFTKTSSLILIPIYSGLGASIATVISYGIGSVFANAIDSRTRIIFNLQMKSLVFFWQK
jgi:hypothetical protein